MVTKPKDTQHKKYININVYQTNSPPKSITPPQEWHSILKFLTLFDTIVKGHKKKKKKKKNKEPQTYKKKKNKMLWTQR